MTRFGRKDYALCLNRQALYKESTVFRWLYPRGSPLPIPNREVKPARADGTALVRESRSLPNYIQSLWQNPEAFLFSNVLGRID
jgi:hypothetical protein